MNKDLTLKEELHKKNEYERIIHRNNLVSKTNIHGDIIYVNDEFCEITGFSRDELMGENHRILKPRENTSEVYKPLWETISSGKTFRGIVRNISKEGKEIYLSTTVSPVFNENNQIIEYIAIRFNVTNEILLQKELELQYLKLQKAYEIAKIGTWEFYTQTKETKCTKELLKIFGINKDTQNIGIKLLNKIVHKDDIIILTVFVQNLVKNSETEHKCTFRILTSKDGIKWVDCRGKKLENENKIIGTLQDITQTKNQAEELEKQNRIISQQSKMATMGEMISNIAHQWRQPLSVITTSASGIKLHKEFGSLTDELFYNAVDSITNSTQYLSKTIDDFREFFNPNKKRVHFNVKNTIDKTFKLVNSQLYSNNIETVFNIKHVNMFGMENELLQVLINILKNAKDELVKQDKEKIIFIELLEYEDSAIIKIKDNAGGIPEKYIDNVFNAYFTTKINTDGTGIGLYMCKEIIEKSMKGKLEAKNETYSYKEHIYKGALFTITIPVNNCMVSVKQA